jgi:hypothetical protein
VRITETSARLLIQDSPRSRWVLGGFFAAAGGLVIAAAFDWVADDWSLLPSARLGLGLLGGLAVAAGAWVSWRAPRFTLVVDRSRRTVTVTHRGQLRHTVEQYPVAAVADVRVTKERERKGEPVYRVELVLHTGSVVPASRPHLRDRAECMRAAQRLWNVLGKPGDGTD